MAAAFSPVRTVRECPVCRAAHGRRIWREDGFHYVRCARCATVFADLTESDYERERHNVWNDEAPTAEALRFYGEARVLAHERFLAAHPPGPADRLLDVGSGLGFFLARAQDAGWAVSGIDTSPSWVELANARLGAARVRLGAVADADFAPGSFTLITAWDVLEHIFAPVPFLARIATWLAPGGRLFLRTPNVAYTYPVYAARRRLLGHPVSLGPTNHVVLFTAVTMRRALAAAGLRPTRWTALPPPQVAAAGAKNAYLAVANGVTRLTGARVVLTSDLDVECAHAGHPPR